MLPIAPREAPSTGARLLVTTDPAAAAGLARIAPRLAAELVQAGHAVALVDEDAKQPRQWLYLPDPPAIADLVDELYAERFAAPRPRFRSVHAAAEVAS